MDNEIKLGVQSCLKCGKKLVGRLDKKFCDAHCRNSYNNQNKSLIELRIQHVHRILRHNRKILRTLCPEGKSTVRRDILDQMGYQYKFYTDIYQSSKGAKYYMVYDYGFTAIREGVKEKALIIQRQDYMDKKSYDPWKVSMSAG